MIAKTHEHPAVSKILETIIHLEDEFLFFSEALWTGSISNKRAAFLVTLYSEKLRHFETCDASVPLPSKPLILLVEAKNPSGPDGNLLSPILFVLPKTHYPS